MSYYDHATLMAFKLERWEEERPLRNHELEALLSNQKAQKTKAIPKRFVWKGFWQRTGLLKGNL